MNPEADTVTQGGESTIWVSEISPTDFYWLLLVGVIALWWPHARWALRWLWSKRKKVVQAEPLDGSAEPSKDELAEVRVSPMFVALAQEAKNGRDALAAAFQEELGALRHEQEINTRRIVKAIGETRANTLDLDDRKAQGQAQGERIEDHEIRIERNTNAVLHSASRV